MKRFTLNFSTRERYCKAVNVIYNSTKYKLTAKGKYLDGSGWYVEFITLF